MDEMKVEFKGSQRFALEGFQSSDPLKVESDGAIEIGGTADYMKIKNKPKIESVELAGDRKLEEFGMSKVRNTDILDLFK